MGRKDKKTIGRNAFPVFGAISQYYRLTKIGRIIRLVLDTVSPRTK